MEIGVKKLVIAVAGNPNVGKSTLFNALTGEKVHVANWPGVTVERKEGGIRFGEYELKFVDLPGIYSLSANSLEEIIAREYIVSGEPDAVLVLVDSTAPERTMYLALQVLELTGRVVIALTKSDRTHTMGIHIHVDKMEEKLGVPVVAISALQGLGLRELLERLVEVAEGKKGRRIPVRVDYGALEPFIREVEEVIRASGMLRRYDSRWAAIRLLEGDPRLAELAEKEGREEQLKHILMLREAVKRSIGKLPEDLAVEARYRFLDGTMKDLVIRVERRESRLIKALDRVYLNPVASPIVSILLIFLVFFVAFSVNLGFPLDVILNSLGMTEAAEAVSEFSLSGLMEKGFAVLSEGVGSLAVAAGAPSWFVSLLTDGVITGVGAVLSFLPLIVLVYALLALLEDSGLAPRIAVAFDGFFRRFGFPGRVLFPIVISLGCNVPAVVATRTIEDEEERMISILAVPFIPCQARLVVLLGISAAIFRSSLAQAASVLSIYLAAFLVFLASGIILRVLLFKRREVSELVLELPPIHKPSAKVVWWLTWDNSKHFLRKAGVIILTLSVVTWFLLNTGPNGMMVDLEESYAAIIGRALAPLGHLYQIEGENAWKVMFALIHGFIAKEAVLEAIALLSPEAGGISEAVQALGLTSMQAYSLLLFATLYVPCLATVAVVLQEARRARYALLLVAYMLAIALLISLAAYWLAVLLL